MQPSFWDISVALRTGMPHWPGSSGFTSCLIHDLSHGDAVNDSDFVTNAHSGTHIDAPLHFLADGCSVDRLALEDLVGPATVVRVEGASEITAAHLESQGLAPATKRVLFRTDNAARWSYPDFDEHYVALSKDAARWLVGRGVRLVGIDYLSVERYGGDGGVHRVLLGAGVVVVEGLDLSQVDAGDYWLACLPLRVVGAEGAPARAVLMRPIPSEVSA